MMHIALLLAAATRGAPHVGTERFAVPNIRYLAILPEIVMLGGAVAMLAVASLVRRPLRMTVATVGTVVISGTSFGLAWWQWADVQSHGPFTAIAHAVVVDGFGVLVTIVVSAAMVLTALVADGYLRREGVEGPELHVLAMVSASGAMLMGEANDLVLVFLGLEILSIALYVLAAFNPRREASGEAALKYFILGAFSSAIFVYGIALTYGATGSTNITQIADFLSKNVLLSDGVLLAGLSLLLVGFCFKIAAVPFHMWTPDVYQGSPSPVTGFMAAVAKVGGFAALLRVFVSSFGVLRADWQPIIYAIAVLSLLGGAGLAVVQRDVKRMLAYSSINHVGFILLGLQAADGRGISAALYYLFAYSFMVIGSFAVVTLVGGRGDTAHDIAGYRGLARRQPLLAFAFAVLLLAQAGAPFTTGFLAKLQVVAAAVDVHSVPLAVIAMASAAVAAFFYLRVAVLMYTPRRTGEAGVEEPVGDLPLEAVALAGAPVGAGVLFGGPPSEAAAGPGGDHGPRDHGNGSGHGGGAAGRGGPKLGPVWAGTDRWVAVATRLNAELLVDADLAAVETAGEAGAVVETAGEAGAVGRLAVPRATALAIGLCVGVTVLFGVWPAPVVDFAHRATLLFFS